MPQSALVGEPPKTDDDYDVVKALMLRLHLDINPAKGIHLVPPPLHPQSDTRAPQILTASIICIALIVFITGSRLSIRAFGPNVKWGWDDWLIIPGAGFALAWFAEAIVYATSGGAGKHMYNLTYHEYYVFERTTKIANLFFLMASTCIKLSLTLFIRRIIGRSSMVWMWVNNVFLALLCIYLVAFMFWAAFLCQPVNESFNLIAAGKLGRPLKCGSLNPASSVRVYSHVVFDFCLLCTPLIILWTVQMPFTKKLRVLATFAFGSVSCVGSVMTLIDQNRLDVTDVTYSIAPLLIWVMIDLFFGILVASAPILQQQLSKAWPSMSGYFRTRLSGYSRTNASLPGVQEKVSSITELKQMPGHDDSEQKSTEITPMREYDMEKGRNRPLEDQHSLENLSLQAPDHLYHPRERSC